MQIQTSSRVQPVYSKKKPPVRVVPASYDTIRFSGASLPKRSGLKALVAVLGSFLAQSQGLSQPPEDPKTQPSVAIEQKAEIAQPQSAIDTSSLEAFKKSHRIQFHYFVPKADRHFIETEDGTPFQNHQEATIARLYRILANRPEILERLGSTLSIHFYDASSVSLEDSPHGRTIGWIPGERRPNEITMCLTTQTLLEELEYTENASETIGHEAGHILDAMNPDGTFGSCDGLLPHWNKEDCHRFKAARAEEKQKIRSGNSLLGNYALKNDNEFLAVLIETYFEQPNTLKESNKALFNLVDKELDYYRDKPLHGSMQIPKKHVGLEFIGLVLSVAIFSQLFRVMTKASR